LLFLAVTAAVRQASAADYWVATTGSNTAGGTQGAPWQTLQYAAGRVNPGDVVHVLAGDYVGFNLTRGGTVASPVRFVAEPGVSVTTRNATTPDGINVEGADYVVIDGFTVNQMPRAGVRCALSSSVTIRGVHADANQRWGIFTGCCPDLVIEDNVTSHSVTEHGIYVSNSADRPIIRRNRSFSNYANGIHMNGDLSVDCSGITAQDGVISGALVEANVIYDNGLGGGSGINCDGVADSVIWNNLIYNTHASGISLYQIDAGAPASNNRVINNTVVVASNGRWALNVTDGSTGNFVRNNVFLTYHAFRGSIVVSADSLTGFSSDHNVLTPRLSPDGDATVLTLAQWQALGYDANSVSALPTEVFADAAADDYHLRAGSPAIDRGDSASAPAADLEGTSRSTGTGPDIGAYERSTTSGTGGSGGAGGTTGGTGGTTGGTGGTTGGTGGTTGGTGGTTGGTGGVSGASGAGAGAGGASGASGTSGGGGSSTGGSATGGSVAIGGSPATGGIGASGGIGAAGTGAGSSSDSGGCGCRASGARSTRPSMLVLVGLSLMLWRRRRSPVPVRSDARPAAAD
jgi:hypothetical protein